MPTLTFLALFLGMCARDPWFDVGAHVRTAKTSREWNQMHARLEEARKRRELPTPQQLREQSHKQIREWRAENEPHPYRVHIHPDTLADPRTRDRFEYAAAAFRILQPVPDAR